MIGGAERWDEISHAVLHWKIKTRSGFRVEPADRVKPGQRPLIFAKILGLEIEEPVEVTQVVQQQDRVGFSYRTRDGHPVRGEEAFIVALTPRGVTLTLRSLTSPSTRVIWRLLYPLLLLFQAIVRRRYFKALRHD